VHTLRAFRIHEDRSSPGFAVRAGFESLPVPQPAAGQVLLRVAYSGINFKDALAASGAGRILRRFPLTGGIDCSGTVVASADARWREGDRALVAGCGLSETHDGGYAEYACVPGDWLVPLPQGHTLWSVMALGTAGFTAALALHKLELNGLQPGQGPVAVSGASGGVGSIAIDLLAARGYAVTAISRKADQTDYLQSLGAAQVLAPDQLGVTGKPLDRAQWAAAVDNVGGELLAGLLAATVTGGSVASIGQAGGAALNTTVMPFILRGVNLLGIGSSGTPQALRLALWQRLGDDLLPRQLARIAPHTIAFDELPGAFDALLQGRSVGRIVVRIDPQAGET
jgi:NADPH2:quinone reductase